MCKRSPNTLPRRVRSMFYIGFTKKIYWVVVIRAECKQEKIYCYRTPIALNFLFKKA